MAKHLNDLLDPRLTHWLVVGPLAWGKAETLHEARGNALRNWSRTYGGPWREVVYRVPADAVVAGLGSIEWSNPEGEDPIDIVKMGEDLFKAPRLVVYTDRRGDVQNIQTEIPIDALIVNEREGFHDSRFKLWDETLYGHRTAGEVSDVSDEFEAFDDQVEQD